MPARHRQLFSLSRGRSARPTADKDRRSRTVPDRANARVHNFEIVSGTSGVRIFYPLPSLPGTTPVSTASALEWTICVQSGRIRCARSCSGGSDRPESSWTLRGHRQVVRAQRKEYQACPDWIAGRAWNRGYIEAFELARIAAWKSAVGVAAITVNKPDEIEACTRAVISAIRPWLGKKGTELASDFGWAAWQQTANTAIGWIGRREPSSGLLSLKGVGYPMATAILDILDPNVWPVIDKWAAKTVFGVIPSRYCAARYAAYARHLVTEGTKYWGAGLSIHQLDEKAQSASMKDGHLPAGWGPCELPTCV
jgi:hypothetical protein